MFSFLKRPSPPPKPARRSSVSDPVLGEVKPVVDGCGWRVIVPPANGSAPIRFHLGGQDAPDPSLIAHAREIVSDYPAFSRRLADFLEARAAAFPTPEGAAEIRQLHLHSISLPWPETPDDGMLYFAGPSGDFRLWRCDYLARRPVQLTFVD